MNPKYEIHEWIDRYLNGEMDELEKRAFEDALQTDQDLVKTLEAQKVANKMVIGDSLIQLKHQMAKDLDNGAYNIGRGGNAGWYYLSGIAITVGVLCFFLYKKQPFITNNQQVPPSSNKEILVQDTVAGVTNSIKEVKTEKPDKNTAESSKQNISSTKAQSSAKKTNLCLDSMISFSCQARGTCLQKEEGAIEIDVKTIKVGNAPYSFSILPEGEFKEASVLSDLKPGKYHLYMKDSKQCLRKLNVEVEVPVINCGNNIILK